MSPRGLEIFLVSAVTAIATISAAVGAMIVLPPGQRMQLPWQERARRVYPARLAPVFNVFLLTQILFMTTALCFAAVGYRPSPLRFVIDCLIPLVGPVAVAMWMAWLCAPRKRPLWYWLAGCVSAVLFRFFNTLIYAVLAAALFLLPRDPLNVIVLLTMGAAGIAFAAWGGGIWVAMVLGLARPALPRAATAADWAGERVGVRAARVFEILWPRVRVSAFGFSRSLVVTDAAATLLSDDELLALSVREISYFKQPWLVGTLRVISASIIFLMLACTAVGAMIGGRALFIGTLSGFGGALLLRPFIRKAELKADTLAAAAAIEPSSALRALEHQYELNLHPVVAVSNRGQEPHLYDRMISAGIPPTYPRPLPPSRGLIILSMAVAGGTCAFLAIILIFGLVAVAA